MLKGLAYVAAGWALFSGIAEARYIGPLLVKEAATGYTLPEYSKTEKCEIFADRTVLTTKFGGAGQLGSVETKTQTLQGNLNAVLQKASKAALVNHNGPVDGPTVKYYGFIINPTDSVTRVTVYDENGGSGQIVTNPSSEAIVLKNVIDSLCPNTMNGIGPAQL